MAVYSGISLVLCIIVALVGSAVALKCYDGSETYNNGQLLSRSLSKNKCSGDNNFCLRQIETQTYNDATQMVKISYGCVTSQVNNGQYASCQREGCYRANNQDVNMVNCCCQNKDYCNSSTKTSSLLVVAMSSILFFVSAKFM